MTDFPKAWAEALAAEDPTSEPKLLVKVICAYHGLDLQPKPADAAELAVPDVEQASVVFICPEPNCPTATYIEIVVRTVPDTSEGEKA